MPGLVWSNALWEFWYRDMAESTSCYNGLDGKEGLLDSIPDFILVTDDLEGTVREMGRRHAWKQKGIDKGFERNPLQENIVCQGNGVQRMSKRGMDIILSIIGIIIVLPFLPIIALLIKLDSRGPVFYLADRVGKEVVPRDLQ